MKKSLCPVVPDEIWNESGFFLRKTSFPTLEMGEKSAVNFLSEVEFIPFLLYSIKGIRWRISIMELLYEIQVENVGQVEFIKTRQTEIVEFFNNYANSCSRKIDAIFTR